MKTNMFKKSITLSLAVLLLAGLYGCGNDEPEKKEETEEATNVTVYKVTTENINSASSYTGEIVASETTAVSAQVSGAATAIYVKEGDYVSAGQPLLSIDSTTYQLAYNQALAAYNSAVAGKKSAEASYNSATGGSSQQSLNQLESAMNGAKLAYDNALDMYNKQKTLFDMGAISQVEFNSHKTNLDNTKLNYESAKKNYELMKNVVMGETENSARAGVETAGAAVEQANAALDIARNNLSNCTVSAPISGYVSSKSANRGQMVGAGSVIFTIADTSSVEVQINVTDSVISILKPGTPAKVTVSGAETDEIGGSVSLINPVKNPQTGLYTVRISIPNENGALKVGMIAKLSLITENSENTLTVPSSALLQSDDDGYYLYVAIDGNAEKRIVETGISNDEFTEILSGVSEGEAVIVKGKEYITKDNSAVKIVTEQGE